MTHVYVKPQDGILLAGPLKSCDLGLQLVLWLSLLCRVRRSAVISGGTLWPTVLGLALSLSVCLVVLLLLLALLLLLRMRLGLWVPLLWLILFPAAAWPFKVLSRARVGYGWRRQVLATDVGIAEALPRSLGTAGPGRAGVDGGVVHSRSWWTFTVRALVVCALAGAALEA